MFSACITGLVYLLAPLPLVFGSFWMGGVSTIEFTILVLVVIIVMIVSCSFALYISSLTRKTINAVLIYYILNIISIPLILAVTLVLGNTYDVLNRYNRISTTHSMVGATLLQYGWVLLCGLHPLTAAVASEVLGLEQQSWFMLQFDVNHYDPLTDTLSLLGTASLPSPWMTFVVIGLGVSVFFLWQATRQLMKPEQ
jgi:hypothetical protein